MVDPAIMCDKHLLGEHVELHMIVGSAQKKIRLDGYVDNNLLEFKNINTRHDQLVTEMLSRGMNHNSPLPGICDSFMNFQSEYVRTSTVEREQSLLDLLNRCSSCRVRHSAIHGV